MRRTIRRDPAPGGDGWLVFRALAVGHFQSRSGSGRRCSTAPNFSPLLDFGLSPFPLLVEPDTGAAFLRRWWGDGVRLLFLSNLNLMLHRLSAMLPDENLRQETKSFTTLNASCCWDHAAGIAFLC